MPKLVQLPPITMLTRCSKQIWNIPETYGKRVAFPVDLASGRFDGSAIIRIWVPVGSPLWYGKPYIIHMTLHTDDPFLYLVPLDLFAASANYIKKKWKYSPYRQRKQETRKRMACVLHELMHSRVLMELRCLPGSQYVTELLSKYK